MAAPRGLGVAFLLVLAAWQLSAAAHQFAHDASVAENCTLCVQLELNEAAALGTTPTIALPNGPVRTASHHQFSHATTFTASYLSRAPPISDD